MIFDTAEQTINGTVIEPGVAWGKQPSEKRPAPVVGKRGRICTGAVIYAGCTIGDDVFVADMARIREGALIKGKCTIGPRASIEFDTVLGNRVSVQQGAVVGECATVGDDAFIGPGAMLVCGKYMSRGEIDPPLIGAQAKVGANAVVMPGVKVGTAAVIGAGAVVTRDVPAGAVWVGVPAGPRGEKTPESKAKMIGYLLVKCECGKEVEVAKRLVAEYQEIDDVVLAFGEYEIVARCRVPVYADLVDLVSNRIRKEVPGISETKTLPGKHIVYRSGGSIVVKDCS